LDGEEEPLESPKFQKQWWRLESRTVTGKTNIIGRSGYAPCLLSSYTGDVNTATYKTKKSKYKAIVFYLFLFFISFSLCVCVSTIISSSIF
jgi:hypothetical protein